MSVMWQSETRTEDAGMEDEAACPSRPKQTMARRALGTSNAAARADAFEAQRARLISIAYRMLGSRAEAEDVVQDVWLKWHAADTAAIATPAAWLTTVATRAAIDRLRHLQTERMGFDEHALPEPWFEGIAPSAEDVALRGVQMSYGVMLMLERLKPAERAAFVLHEAFECDYAEIASILQRTSASCRQLVHRAKSRLQREGAVLDQPLSAGATAAHAAVIERLRAAIDAQDRDALLRLLGESASIETDVPTVSAAVQAQAQVQMQAEPVSADAAPVAVTARAAANVTASAAADAAANASASQRDMAPFVDSLINDDASETHVVMCGDMPMLALLDGAGDIVALVAVTNEAQRAMQLRILTQQSRLVGANRVFGSARVRKLLEAIAGPVCECA